MGAVDSRPAARFEEAGLTLFERGWLSSNNVLFRAVGDGESVLVDSGYWSHAEQTVALVRAALGEASLDRVLNTHLHSDHCGGNHALQIAFGCAVTVPAAEASKVDGWDEARLTYQATGQQCPRFVREGIVDAGESIRLGPLVWQVIGAPGHDPESVILHQQDLKLLISADALWENGFGVVFPEIEGVGAFSDVARTLDCIAALPIDWVIPGHGAPFSDIGDALGRARSRLDGFVASPLRHARHAAKVLLKFHLLEHQVVRRDALQCWMRATPYTGRLHASYFAQLPFDDWIDSLVRELASNRVLRVDGDSIHNL
jgi:glyoxylase-like metal-dependent hydrolase (beta-lactamase superfamily II)